MKIHPAVAARLAKIIPRLASDHEGEVIATVLAIRRTLEGAGLDLHALAAGIGGGISGREPGWHEIAVWCDRHGENRLSTRELDFVANMATRLARGGTPTARQAAWLRSIYDTLRKGAS